MISGRSKLNRILLKSISVFFVVWLSGVFVLIGCGSHFFSVFAMNSTEVEAEICPLGKGHECCKKKSKAENDSPKVSEDQNKTIDCCAFKPNKTLSADLSNSKVTKQSAVASKKPEISKAIFFNKESREIPQVSRPIIRDRGSTYLRNCVFRI
jgi:hypothetical protein